MDNDRLQKIFDNYSERYEALNNTERHEIAKWSAISNFQKYWDQNAEHFGEMFKRAMEGEENLISEASFQPIQGVAFLCSKGPEIEDAVREAFRALLAPDESDYAVRQTKAEVFVRTMNDLLRSVDAEKWKYHQNITAAILYLSFVDPEDNYLFREDEAKAFAEYVGFEEPIIENELLSIPNYYRMCDQLATELIQQEDLLKKVDARLEEEADETDDSSVTEVDSENHILAFDIIYCAHNYELYDERTAAPKKRRRKKSAADEAKEREEALLKMQLRSCRTKIRNLEKKKLSMKEPDLTGVPVRHSRFGDGEITARDGQRLTVKFAAGEKKFMLPDAFTKGFLKTDNEAAAVYLQTAGIGEQIHALQLEEHLLDVQINGMEDK